MGYGPGHEYRMGGVAGHEKGPDTQHAVPDPKSNS